MQAWRTLGLLVPFLFCCRWFSFCVGFCFPVLVVNKKLKKKRSKRWWPVAGGHNFLTRALSFIVFSGIENGAKNPGT
jgi:hypothetical protein